MSNIGLVLVAIIEVLVIIREWRRYRRERSHRQAIARARSMVETFGPLRKGDRFVRNADGSLELHRAGEPVKVWRERK